MSSTRCELLSWDSQFFGFPVGRLASGRLDATACAQAIVWCREHGIRVLYFLAPSDDPATIAVLEDHGFRLVDVRIELDRTIESGHAEAGLQLEAAGPQDIPRMRELAATEHRVTRFYQDHNFSRLCCDELYRTWITESLRGFADVVLVVRDDDQVTGYVTVRVEDGAARIGLIAVDPATRGRGYGGRLIQGAIAYAAARGARQAWVATQGRNVDALRLYERHGFRVRRLGLWYHRWFETQTISR